MMNGATWYGSDQSFLERIAMSQEKKQPDGIEHGVVSGSSPAQQSAFSRIADSLASLTSLVLALRRIWRKD